MGSSNVVHMCVYIDVHIHVHVYAHVYYDKIGVSCLVSASTFTKVRTAFTMTVISLVEMTGL